MSAGSVLFGWDRSRLTERGPGGPRYSRPGGRRYKTMRRRGVEGLEKCRLEAGPAKVEGDQPVAPKAADDPSDTEEGA